jgi:hypothetical protein
VHRKAATGFLLMAFLASFADGQDKQVSAQPQEPRLRCHDRGIRLEGTLVRRWFYGPPGFGETPKRDARDEVFVLQLAHPITVLAPPDPTKDETCADKLAHVTKVQVWAFQEHQTEIREKTGKAVAITGTLDEDPAPGAHINVQITPESIEVK